MKRHKNIKVLILINILILLVTGCKNEGEYLKNKSEEINTSDIQEETNNFITEDEIWNKADKTARDTIRIYGNHTIEGLKVVSDKAKQYANEPKKSIDESIIETM